MAGDDKELKAWCDEARKILGTVREGRQVGSISRKDLRHIRHSFENVVAKIDSLQAFKTCIKEARGFKARYAELIKALENSDGGPTTRNLGLKIGALELEVTQLLDSVPGKIEKIGNSRIEFVKRTLLEIKQAEEHAKLDQGPQGLAKKSLNPKEEREREIERLLEARRPVQLGEELEQLEKALALARTGDLSMLDRLAKVVDTTAKFKPLPEGEKLGSGNWAIKGLMTYSPSGPLNIPGSDFDDICPGQDHVNKAIVEQKLQDGMASTPVIPAAINENGQIFLLDKHHAFVACMALGKSVKIGLTPMPGQEGRASWGDCTWASFSKKPVPGAGFSLKKEESEKHEGKREQNPKWKEIVPWREGGQELDASERPATPDETGKTIESVAEGMDKLERKTQEEFVRQLQGALQVGPVQEHLSTLLGGKDFKIKFDPDATEAYLQDSTIILPTADGKGGKPRSPADLLDALIFESCNVDMAEHRKKLDFEFDKSGDDLTKYGKDKAGLEASLTVLRSSKMVYQMTLQDCEIAQQGGDNIKAIRELDPTYFEEVVGKGAIDENGEQVDHSEREARLVKLLQAKVSETKHQKALDPENKEDVRNPQWLKSGELYHYEKVKSLGAVAMARLILSAVSKAGSTFGWNNKELFQGWLHTHAALYIKNRDLQPLLFCKLLEAAKQGVPDADFSGLAFNSDMLRCALANGDGVAGVAAPPLITVAQAKGVDMVEVETSVKLKLGQLREALKKFAPKVQPGTGRKFELEKLVMLTAGQSDEEGDDMVEALKKVDAALLEMEKLAL